MITTRGRRRGKPGRGPAEAPPRDVRSRLLLAAAELFARKGYAATPVGEVVAAAGVTKPALYYYFRSKEGLYLEMMREGSAEFLRILERHRGARGDGAAGHIRALCAEVFELLLARIPVVRVMYAVYYGPPQGAPHFDFDAFHDRFRETLARLVRRGMARGELRAGDPGAAVLAVTGALSACIESTICHPERAIGAEALAGVLDAVFRGIAAGREGSER